MQPNSLYWLSPFSLADGYGVAASAMVEMLMRYDADLSIHETWFFDRSELGKTIIEKLKIDASKPMRSKYGIAMSTPGAFARLPTPVKIGYTMYESNKPEGAFPGWYKDMARADAIFVPAENSRTVFAPHYKGKIYIQPIPLLARYMGSRLRKRLTGNTVRFGIHGTLTERKCPLETIEAFKKAFPPNITDVRLDVKTRNILGSAQGAIPRMKDSRITIFNETWNSGKMHKWLQSLDCHLFISRGEGFGLPPRESMVTGCPVVVSDSTALKDITSHAFTVPIKRQVGAVIGGVWDEPDFDALVEIMRDIYKNRDKAADRGIEAANWYREEFSWQNIYNTFNKNMSAISSEFATRPVVADFGRSPVETKTVNRIGAVIRKWAEPRCSILFSGWGDDLLASWFSRRAFSSVSIEDHSVIKDRPNMVMSYGNKYDLTNIITKDAFNIAVIKVEPHEMISMYMRDILNQAFSVADKVVIVFQGKFINRYAILFEGIDNTVEEAGEWTLVLLTKEEVINRGFIVRSKPRSIERQRHTGKIRLEHNKNGIQATRGK